MLTRPADLALAVALVGLLAAAGCASGGPDSWPPLRPGGPPEGAPATLEPADPSLRLTPGDTLAGSGCLSPLLDPGRERRLLLVRSVAGQGDYEVPSGAYGLAPGELLRVDCNTGRPLGVVRR